MKGKFNKTSEYQFREIYAHHYKNQQDTNELLELIREKPSSLQLLSIVPPWSHFYELSYIDHLFLFIIEFKLADIVRKSAHSDNQVEAFLQEMESLEEQSIPDEVLSEEEIAYRFSLTLANIHQVSSISIFHQPLSDLVIKARKGDDEALFDAVLVDRSVMSAPSIAHRIQFAQIMHDEDFMDLLSKAVKRSRPRRPTEKLDHVRYMLEVIDEEIGLKNVTYNNLYDLLSEDLELYDDSIDGLKKLIQRRNKRHGT